MALMTVSIEPSRMRDSSPSRSIDDVRSAGAGTLVLLGFERIDPPGSALRPRGSARGGKEVGKVARGCTGMEASRMIRRVLVGRPGVANPVSLLQRFVTGPSHPSISWAQNQEQT